MRSIGLTLLGILAILLLLGCETDPYMVKYQQAKNGTYHGPDTPVSLPPEPVASRPITREFNSAMYYGMSTVNTPLPTLRDDHLAGTFRVPYNTGAAGAVGYQPTVGQMVNGASLGVRSTVVPPANAPGN